MKKVPQFEPITRMQTKPTEILAMLDAGPVILAQRSKAAAVLVRIPKPVRRRIEALPGRYRQRVWRLIQSLTTNPRPAGAKQLREREQMYRIALDDYRIVYSIEDDLLIIEVVKVGSCTFVQFIACPNCRMKKGINLWYDYSGCPLPPAVIEPRRSYDHNCCQLSARRLPRPIAQNRPVDPPT